MMRRYNRDVSPSATAASDLYQLMDQLPDAVFIGDNPLDRYNPNTLDVPLKGANARLLAGSYDLYSPRQTQIMERFQLTNPLRDAIDRLDVVYVDMSGSMLLIAVERLYQIEGWIVTTQPPTVGGTTLLTQNAAHRMQLYWLQSMTLEEYEALLEQYRLMQAFQAPPDMTGIPEGGTRTYATQPDPLVKKHFEEEAGGIEFDTQQGIDANGLAYVDYFPKGATVPE